jgi:hypothetical protein
MSCLSGYLDMNVATAVRKGENVMRLKRFRKLWRHLPALTLPYARARGQEGENDLDQRDRGLVPSRQLLAIKRVEVDGVSCVMSWVSVMDTASYFAHADLVTTGRCSKNDLQQERLDSCGPSRT